MSVLTHSASPSRAARLVALIGFAALSTPLAFAQATTACGPDVKEAVNQKIAALGNASDAQKASVYAELYKQYQYCAQDSSRRLRSSSKPLGSAEPLCRIWAACTTRR